MQLFRLIIRNTFVVILLCLIGGVVAGAKTNPRIPAPIQGGLPASTVTCSASPEFVIRVSGSSVVTITAHASDPDNNIITYRWSASGGATVSGSGSRVTLDTADLAPGKYTVTVTVRLGHGDTVVCSSTVTVREKIIDCPTVSLSVDPRTVEMGTNTRATFHVTAWDPIGDPLTYQWHTSSGTLSGTGDTVTLDTTGMRGGIVRVSVSVSDGKCQSNDSATLTINPKLARPLSVRSWLSSSCNTYKRLNDTRPDKTCKGFLDDVAAHSKQDPRAILVIQGYSQDKEKANIAQQRAERVRDYLVNKGIGSSRIKIQSKGNTAAPGASGDNNKVVVIWFVPEGASEPQ